MTSFATQTIKGNTIHRLQSALAHLFIVEDFLLQEHCNQLISTIEQKLHRSTILDVQGSKEDQHRTSQTAHLIYNDLDLSKAIDQRISNLLGISAELSEPIQGQRYYAHEYYKAHHDWFNPEVESGQKELELGGQRTWTFMIYLNDVEQGGETYFPLLNVMFTPMRGRAVCWRNIHSDGSINHSTLHEAKPVLAGNKYIVTKWFREKAGRNTI